MSERQSSCPKMAQFATKRSWPKIVRVSMGLLIVSNGKVVWYIFLRSNPLFLRPSSHLPLNDFAVSRGWHRRKTGGTKTNDLFHLSLHLVCLSLAFLGLVFFMSSVFRACCLYLNYLAFCRMAREMCTEYRTLYIGITYINVGQNLLLLAKVWWHNLFIIIKSSFLTNFVVSNFLLVRPKDSIEQKARFWTVKLFVVFFLNF